MAQYTAPVKDGELVYDYQKLKNEKEQSEKTQAGSKLGYDQFLTLLGRERHSLRHSHSWRQPCHYRRQNRAIWQMVWLVNMLS